MSFSNLEVVQESTLAAERGNMSFSNLEVVLESTLAAERSTDPGIKEYQETTGFIRISFGFYPES